MNICAVRTYAEYNLRTSGWGWMDYPKPHEPKSEHRYAMPIISTEGAEAFGYQVGKRFIGDYAECKHCNSIFAVDAQDEMPPVESQATPPGRKPT